MKRKIIIVLMLSIGGLFAKSEIKNHRQKKYTTIKSVIPSTSQSFTKNKTLIESKNVSLKNNNVDKNGLDTIPILLEKYKRGAYLSLEEKTALQAYFKQRNRKGDIDGIDHNRFVKKIMNPALFPERNGITKNEYKQRVILDKNSHSRSNNNRSALTEGFEESVFPPEGWEMVSANAVNDITQSDENAYNGIYSARFSSYDSAEDYKQYIITPKLSVSSSDLFSFWYASDGYGSESFRVGISTTIDDTASFIFGDEIADASSDWQQYSMDLSSYANQEIFIAIKYTSDYQYYLYIDDIEGPEVVTVDEALAFIDPEFIDFGYVEVSNSSNQTVTLSNDGTIDLTGTISSDNAHFTLDISSFTLAPNSLDSITITYSPLESSHAVGNIIFTHNGNSSPDTLFVNGTSIVNNNFTEGFEGDNFPPLGWEIVSRNGENSVIQSNNHFYSGSNSAMFSSYDYASGSTPDYTQYLITPKLNVEANNAFSFWYSNIDAGVESFMVGISTTDDDPNSFIFGDEISDASSTWKQTQLDLSDFENQQIYVAIKYTSIYQYYLYIDEIEGPALYSSDEPVANINTDNIDFGFVDQSSFSSQSLQISNFGNSNLVGTVSSNHSAFTVDESSYSILPDSVHNLIVTYTPTGEGNDLGELIFTHNGEGGIDTVFLSGTSIVSNNFMENFDDTEFPPANWSIISNNTVNAIIQSDETSHSGDYSVRFSSYDSANDYTQYLITPQLTVLPGDSVSFWYASYGAGSESFSVGISTTNNDESSFVYGDVIIDASMTWQEYSMDLSSWGGQQIFVAIKYTSNFQYYLYIDDMSGPEIFVPEGVVASLSTDNIEFGFVQESLSSMRPITISNLGTEDLVGTISSDNTAFAVDSESFTIIGGLSHTVNVTYSPSGNGDDTGNIVFTHNGNSSPDGVTVSGTSNFSNTFSEGFEGDFFPPQNWLVYSNNSSNNVSQSNNFAHSGNNSVRFSSFESASDYTQHLVTPLLNVSSNDSISFWYRSENVGIETFSVGISTTNQDLSSFTFGPEINNASGSWQKYTEDLDLYSGQQLYIAIKYLSDYQWYLYLDDFTGPEMYVQNEAVANISTEEVHFGNVSLFGSSSSTVSISNVGSQDLIGTIVSDNSAFTIDVETFSLGIYTEQTIQITYTPTFEGEENGRLIFSHNGTTSPDTVWMDGYGSTHLLEEDFENASWSGTPSAPAGWTQISVSGTSPWVRNQSESAYSGEYQAMAPYSSNGGNHLLITPSLNFGDGSTAYQLNFWLDGSEYSGTDLHILMGNSTSSELDFTDTLASFTAGENMPITYTEQFVNLVGLTGEKYIAFNMVDDFGWSLFMDNILVHEVSSDDLAEFTPTVSEVIFFPTIIGETVSESNFSIGLSSGVSAIIVDSISSTNPDYSVLLSDGNTVNAGQEIAVNIEWMPSTFGLQTADIILYHNAISSPDTFKLIGEAGRYSVNFDNQILPSGWENLDESNDGFPWVFDYAYNGPGYTGDPDGFYARSPGGGAWLSTSKLSVVAGDSLIFYTNSSGYDDSGLMEILVSTTTNDINNFTQIDSVQFDGFENIRKALSLDMYVGSQIYIAFRDESFSSINDFHRIDDILLPEREETSTYVYGVVSDGNSGQAMSGVNIMFQEYELQSDENGFYAFSNISSGNSVLTFSMNGYASAYFNLEISDGDTIEQNISLYTSSNLIGPSSLSVESSGSNIVLSWVSPQVASQNSGNADNSMFDHKSLMERENNQNTTLNHSRDLISYNVFRSQTFMPMNHDEFDLIANVSDVIYTDESTEENQQYYYYVSAVYDEGESAGSDWVGAGLGAILDSSFLSVSQNFEMDDFSGWTSSNSAGNGWAIGDANSNETAPIPDGLGSYAFINDGVTDSDVISRSGFISPFFHLLGDDSKTLSFDYFNESDNQSFQVYISQGWDNWVLLGDLPSMGYAWNLVSVDLSDWNELEHLRIMFFYSDNQTIAQSVAIDNIEIDIIPGPAYINLSSTLENVTLNWAEPILNQRNGNEEFHPATYEEKMTSIRENIGNNEFQPNQVNSRQGGDTFNDAFVIDALPFSEEGTTIGYVNNYGLSINDLNCYWEGWYDENASGMGADVVYQLSLSLETNIVVSLCGSEYDTGLGIFKANSTDTTFILGNDDYCGMQSRVECVLDSGLYFIVVDGYENSEGDYTLQIEGDSFVETTPYLYTLYKDGQVLAENMDTTVFVDNNATLDEACYTVTAFANLLGLDGNVENYVETGSSSDICGALNNLPPTGLSLFTPFTNDTLIISNENMADQIQFNWSDAEDPNGTPVSYEICYSILSGWEQCYTVNSETEFIMNISDLASVVDSLFQINGEHIQVLDWNVIVSDGIYDIQSSNGPFSITLIGDYLLGIKDNLMPKSFALHQNFPNPFNPTTTIQFDVPKQSYVKIDIYNLLGRRVKTLVKKSMPAGFHSVMWNGTNEKGNPLSTGMYIYQINAGEFHSVRKLVLMK